MRPSPIFGVKRFLKEIGKELVTKEYEKRIFSNGIISEN